jgi:molybdenum cofactor guanylyltransferase
VARTQPGPRSGVVLVGGRSSRLGSPKALLDLAGAPLLRHVLAAVAPSCDEIVLVAAPRASEPPELTTGLTREARRLARAWPDAPPRCGAAALTPRVRTVRDARPHLGPVSGLATGLAAARGAVAWVAACDVPFLAPTLIEGLVSLAETEGADVVMPRWRGFLEPLLAVYRPSTMAALFARQLAGDVLKPTAWLDRVRLRVVEDAELARLDPDGASFLNVNVAADVEIARARIAARATEINAPARRRGRSRRGSSSAG